MVRDEKGTPFNWVLFTPSKDTLEVWDAGSGSVMEMGRLLETKGSDKLLYGLSRVAFGSGNMRRQYWFKTDWKGENCSGVKLIKLKVWKLRVAVCTTTKFYFFFTVLKKIYCTALNPADARPALPSHISHAPSHGTQRDCEKPMQDMIGAASFSLACHEPGDISPEAVVAKVKSSVVIEGDGSQLSVSAFVAAYEEEQAEIKAFYEVTIDTNRQPLAIP